MQRRRRIRSEGGHAISSVFAVALFRLLCRPVGGVNCMAAVEICSWFNDSSERCKWAGNGTFVALWWGHLGVAERDIGLND